MRPWRRRSARGGRSHGNRPRGKSGSPGKNRRSAPPVARRSAGSPRYGNARPGVPRENLRRSDPDGLPGEDGLRRKNAPPPVPVGRKAGTGPPRGRNGSRPESGRPGAHSNAGPPGSVPPHGSGSRPGNGRSGARRNGNPLENGWHVALPDGKLPARSCGNPPGRVRAGAPHRRLERSPHPWCDSPGPRSMQPQPRSALPCSRG